MENSQRIMSKRQFLIRQYISLFVVILCSVGMSFFTEYLYGHNPSNTFLKIGKTILIIINIVTTGTLLLFIGKSRYKNYIARKLKTDEAKN